MFDDSQLVDELSDLCTAQNWTLSFAESCTGGLLSAKLTEKSGTSKFFLGSVVSYSNDLKSNILGVSPDQIDRYGAVSTQVALSMAQGVQKISKSTWSVSISGIAGPSGGSPDKPVGTVCFGIIGPKIEETEVQVFKGNRIEVQNAAAQYAMKMILSRA